MWPGRNGKISDIAVYCQKLERLNIEINPSVDAGDYIPFAKLPCLQMWNIRGTPMKNSSRKLFKSLAESTTIRNLNLSQMVINPEEIEELSNLRAVRSLSFQLQSSITNIAQNSINKPDLPVVAPSILDIAKSSIGDLGDLKYISNFPETKNKNMIAVDNIFTHKQCNEQYIRTNNKDIEGFIVSAQTNINSFYAMEEMCNTLNIPTHINKIASFFVLKSFASLLNKYAESINLLGKLKNLSYLVIQMKINIQHELRELQKTTPLVDLVDIEEPIPLDPTSQNLIFLYLLKGLNKIFTVSKTTNVTFDKSINNCEIILFLTFHFQFITL